MAARRVVSRHVFRRNATEVRRRIERAQSVVLDRGGAEPFSDPEYARARATLSRYGVNAYEDVVQARRRWGGWWRVLAG